MMLASRSLPDRFMVMHNTPCLRYNATSNTRYNATSHSQRRWRCVAVSSESAASGLEGTRSKVTDARSNIVPNGLRRFPSRSDREDQGLAAILKKLPATNYSALLSSAGKARTPGGLNTVLESYNEQPECDRIPLHGGLPHPSAFPFAQLTVKLTSGSTLTIDNPDLVTDAQQYATHLLGLPNLQEWTQQHMEEQHSPPGPFQVLISNGSNHAIEMVTDLLLERGDSILCESFTYFYLVDSVLPIKGYNAIPMDMDNHGICPTKLRQILQEKALTGQVPRVMYTVPTGHNPTGVVTPLCRKREIYSICQEYNIIVVEDDAYYYLQYPDLQGEVPGLEGLTPSYLSIDTDSRVVRLDSWSKVLAPGLRLGWVSAHPEIVDLMALALHASPERAPGGLPGLATTLDALMIAVTQQWGKTGFQEHCSKMQHVYQNRANIMHQAAIRELQGLAEWQQPKAGMFIWLKLLAGIRDVDEIAADLVKANVMVLPGKLAHCQGAEAAYPCPYIRLSFANASEVQIEEGMQRLGDLLRKHQQTLLLQADSAISNNTCS